MSKMVKSLLVLVSAVVLIHMMYAGFIRPQAELVVQLAREAGSSTPRNMFIILKDFEQEICLILLVWGMYLIGVKLLGLLKERYLFSIDLLDEAFSEWSRELPNWENLDKAIQSLENLPQDARDTPLIETLLGSLRRFRITEDIQNTSDAIQVSLEALALRLEADNSMIRYLIWVIPSIGFIGTVRGIGQALAQVPGVHERPTASEATRSLPDPPHAIALGHDLRRKAY